MSSKLFTVSQSKKTTFSVTRYLYLNSYGLFILFTGLVTGLVPFFFDLKILLCVLLWIFSLYQIYNGIVILTMWPEKKGWYEKLISINARGFKASSFESFMQTPCGRLLTKAVLSDLNSACRYNELKKLYVIPIRESISNYFHPKPTVVRFSDKALEMLEKENHETI